MSATMRLRNLADVNPPSPIFDALGGDSLVTFMPLEAVWADGRCDLARTRPKREVGNGYVRFQKGDVLSPKVTPTFQAGRSAWIARLPTGAGAASTEVHVVRAIAGRSDPRFIRYVLLSKPFLDEGVSQFQGVAGLQRVPAEFLRDFPVARLSIDQQRRIADFLDDQVARINNIIAARKAQTELLTSVVLATADEAISTASTKVVALRRVISKWIDYRGATPAKTNSGVRLITAGNIRGGLVDLSAADEYIAYDDYSEWMRRWLPRVGDILLTTEAPLGQVAQIVDTSIALAQRIILLRPNYDLLNGDWLYWYLRSPQGQRELFSRATGSTAQGIKAERLYGIPIWIPPLSVQESLARRIRSSALNAEACLESIQSTIERLVELKRSLITAAVSGEFDVSSADGSQIPLGMTMDVPARTPVQPAEVAV